MFYLLNINFIALNVAAYVRAVIVLFVMVICVGYALHVTFTLCWANFS